MRNKKERERDFQKAMAMGGARFNRLMALSDAANSVAKAVDRYERLKATEEDEPRFQMHGELEDLLESLTIDYKETVETGAVGWSLITEPEEIENFKAQFTAELDVKRKRIDAVQTALLDAPNVAEGPTLSELRDLRDRYVEEQALGSKSEQAWDISKRTGLWTPMWAFKLQVLFSVLGFFGRILVITTIWIASLFILWVGYREGFWRF